MRSYKVIFCFAALCALAVLSFSGRNVVSAQAEKVRIAVISSSNAKPFEEAIEGFLSCLKKEGLEYVFDIYLMEGDATRGETISGEIKKKSSSLVFAVGSIATFSVLQHVKDIPVISGVILRSSEIEKNQNSMGVFLEFPMKTQFERLRQILPEAKNVGVIYNPSVNQEKIDEALRVSREMGLNLIAREVSSPRELPGALNFLEKRVEVLWAIPDKLVLNPRTAKHILLFSFRNRIPFVGLSSAWVKAGALYALDWDYSDMGVQCGEIAKKVIQGVPIGSIKFFGPRKVLYSLNLKTARILKVNIAEDILRKAHRVYQGGN